MFWFLFMSTLEKNHRNLELLSIPFERHYGKYFEQIMDVFQLLPVQMIYWWSGKRECLIRRTGLGISDSAITIQSWYWIFLKDRCKRLHSCFLNSSRGIHRVEGHKSEDDRHSYAKPQYHGCGCHLGRIVFYFEPQI